MNSVKPSRLTEVRLAAQRGSHISLLGVWTLSRDSTQHSHDAMSEEKHLSHSINANPVIQNCPELCWNKIIGDLLNEITLCKTSVSKTL